MQGSKVRRLPGGCEILADYIKIDRKGGKEFLATTTKGERRVPQHYFGRVENQWCPTTR